MHVEITSSGRGGTITYREPPHSLEFSWEFAMPPALALIFGPSATAWAKIAPWAADRHEEIVTAVAHEVVRQKAAGRGFSFDPDSGIIEIR
ncbi:MAG: hypothetical protein WDO68_18805 [Gammaproteobacteria bacterium]